jgi:muramoyltetrapeptide carboxypeptidase
MAYAPVVSLAAPPPLAPGDLIAVVAPSGPLRAGELWSGLAWLRARYRICIGPGALARDGYLAGGDERRAGELAKAMGDPEVKAIVAARGGYGAMRIVDALPWKMFARRPKWIVGFSDVTTLHAMAWSTGIASVHSPNAIGLGSDASVATRAAWLASLERPGAYRAWRSLRVVRSGDGGGPIVGGNLALVNAMAAAGRLHIPKGAVLALEDVGEAPYRVDRMLTALALGGHFARASAVVFGGFDRCTAGIDGPSVEETLDRCTRSLGIPVLAGAPFGHGERNEAFVLGASVRVLGGSVVWGHEDDAPEGSASPG